MREREGKKERFGASVTVRKQFLLQNNRQRNTKNAPINHEIVQSTLSKFIKAESGWDHTERSLHRCMH